jgi:tripartite-type tricarboxylate transporter receptor subunit TctC
MVLSRRQILSFAAASAASPLLARGASAASYPTQPVRVLVGFPAGGGADVLTRTMAEWLQSRLGQPFVVDNRPGAATNIATEAVVRAPADGYTLLATTTSNLINGALYPELKYDFIKDIAPIACISIQPLALVVTPTLTARTLPELVAFAKAKAGTLNIGHTGTGTVSHLAIEAFKQATGVDAVVVPYRGFAPMAPDLLAGRIHATIDNIASSIEHIRSGTLRALAVTTAARSDALPGVPSVSELIPGYEAIAVAGFAAPKATGPLIIDKLNSEINSGLADPALKARLVKLGVTTVGGSPADFAKLIARETARWSMVIKTAGIKPE